MLLKTAAGNNKKSAKTAHVTNSRWNICMVNILYDGRYLICIQCNINVVGMSKRSTKADMTLNVNGNPTVAKITVKTFPADVIGVICPYPMVVTIVVTKNTLCPKYQLVVLSVTEIPFLLSTAKYSIRLAKSTKLTQGYLAMKSSRTFWCTFKRFSSSSCSTAMKTDAAMQRKKM